jgi:heme-degrading monooxygenase HmoA
VILRVLRGRAERGDVARLLSVMAEDASAWAAVGAGPRTTQPAMREAEEAVEFLIVSTWSDAEAVLAHGQDLRLPRGRLADPDHLGAGRAEHYELMLSVGGGGSPDEQVLRLSSMALVPSQASAFYAEVRHLWEKLVGDAGLVAVHVGRRVTSNAEQAVVVTVWATQEDLDAAMSGGFAGGEEMHRFYATEPTIEHFRTLALPSQDT